MPSLAALRAPHDQPFPLRVYQAATVQRWAWDPCRQQFCISDSLETGECSEDWAHFAQSARRTSVGGPNPMNGLSPHCRIRLATDRSSLSPEVQALAFLCGAGADFAGENPLITPDCGAHQDQAPPSTVGLARKGAPE